MYIHLGEKPKMRNRGARSSLGGLEEALMAKEFIDEYIKKEMDKKKDKEPKKDDKNAWTVREVTFLLIFLSPWIAKLQDYALNYK